MLVEVAEAGFTISKNYSQFPYLSMYLLRATAEYYIHCEPDTTSGHFLYISTTPSLHKMRLVVCKLMLLDSYISFMFM